MATTPPAVSKRFIKAVPKFKKILARAKERDVNESDTVTIVTDMLEEIFGFDKYSEITREYSIQGTFCDLAIKTTKGVEYLIEVKAIGLTPNEGHLKQAVNYASREGIKWVVLTNGTTWHIHRVTLDEKVRQERLFSFDFSELNPRLKEQQETLFLLCKRGVQKDLIDEYYEYRQSVNRYTVGTILLTDEVTNVVRRELRKIKTGIKVNNEEIKALLSSEIIKRDILESDAGKEAFKQLTKVKKKEAKAKAKKVSKSSSSANSPVSAGAGDQENE
jgi:predicted type IV restriction endonuclease